MYGIVFLIDNARVALNGPISPPISSWYYYTVTSYPKCTDCRGDALRMFMYQFVHCKYILSPVTSSRLLKQRHLFSLQLVWCTWEGTLSRCWRMVRIPTITHSHFIIHNLSNLNPYSSCRCNLQHVLWYQVACCWCNLPNCNLHGSAGTFAYLAVQRTDWMFPWCVWSYRRVLGVDAMQLAQDGLYCGIHNAFCAGRAARGGHSVILADVLHRHRLRIALLWILHGRHTVAQLSVVGQQEQRMVEKVSWGGWNVCLWPDGSLPDHSLRAALAARAI